MQKNKNSPRAQGTLAFFLLLGVGFVVFLFVMLLTSPVLESTDSQDPASEAPLDTKTQAGESQAQRPATRGDLIIYLDAGHGGFDPGASAAGEDGKTVYEKDLVLVMSEKIGDRLTARGYTVLYARRDDSRHTYTTASAEVLARRQAAEKAGASLILSLHLNAYRGEGRAYGARVYYNPAAAGGEASAAIFANAISRHTSGIIGRDAVAVADDTYIILANPALPALLLEMGFITDKTELAAMQSVGWQNGMADAIAEACDSYLFSP